MTQFICPVCNTLRTKESWLACYKIYEGRKQILIEGEANDDFAREDYVKV